MATSDSAMSRGCGGTYPRLLTLACVAVACRVLAPHREWERAPLAHLLTDGRVYGVSPGRALWGWSWRVIRLVHRWQRHSYWSWRLRLHAEHSGGVRSPKAHERDAAPPWPTALTALAAPRHRTTTCAPGHSERAVWSYSSSTAVFAFAIGGTPNSATPGSQPPNAQSCMCFETSGTLVICLSSQMYQSSLPVRTVAK